LVQENAGDVVVVRDEKFHLRIASRSAASASGKTAAQASGRRDVVRIHSLMLVATDLLGLF
jgi:hypothetical protein